MKESIRRVTATGAKHAITGGAGGHEAAREIRISGQKGKRPFVQETEDDEAMIEESFSVGGSEIDDEHYSQAQTEDDAGIDSSGKQKLADIK